jgi:hypothetical protein
VGSSAISSARNHSGWTQAKPNARDGRAYAPVELKRPAATCCDGPPPHLPRTGEGEGTLYRGNHPLPVK